VEYPPEARNAKKAGQIREASGACTQVSAGPPAAFARNVAVSAEDGTILTRYERYGSWLAAARADNRRSLHGRATIAGCFLTCPSGGAAWPAAFRGGVAVFLEKRLVGSGEGELFAAITAFQLEISDHQVTFPWILSANCDPRN